MLRVPIKSNIPCGKPSYHPDGLLNPDSDITDIHNVHCCNSNKRAYHMSKAGGVILSFIGIIYLILNRAGGGNGAHSTSLFGIVMIILNSLSFSMYLGIFKPLIAKYSVVTFVNLYNELTGENYKDYLAIYRKVVELGYVK